MYLYIFEDGTIRKTNELEPDDLKSVNDGYLTIVDISIPGNPKEFYQKEWIEIEYN